MTEHRARSTPKALEERERAQAEYAIGHERRHPLQVLQALNENRRRMRDDVVGHIAGRLDAEIMGLTHGDTPPEHQRPDFYRPARPDAIKCDACDVDHVAEAYALQPQAAKALEHLLTAGRRPGVSYMQALHNAVECLQLEIGFHSARGKADE